MILLGVDPGLHIAGFSVLKKNGRTVILLECGYLKMPFSKNLAARVSMFHDFFTAKIEQWAITDVALETPFLGKNAQNFLKLGYVRGILYLLSHKHQLKLHEFSPREVKQAITGYGGASKEQVARIVLQLFPRIETPKKDDVTDALAVSLCGLWRQKTI